MFDPTRDKLDRDFDESMRMFDKALVATNQPIEPKRPSKILVALDGSSQDVAVVDAARTLQARFECKVLVLDGRETEDPSDEMTQLDEAAAIAGAELIAKGSGPSYDQILTTVDGHGPDLVVMPCPFGRDFEAIGVESVGTVIDVLLSRCRVPLLVIRHPDQKFAAACEDVSLVVSAECDAETLAAAWALGLAGESASVSLDVVTDKEQMENLKQVLSVLAPEKVLEAEDLNEALAKGHASLHATMQQAAFARGLKYTLQPRAGETAPPLLSEETQPQLIVLASEVDDRFVEGFVHDRIRRSPHHLLIASTHTVEA